MENEFTLTLVFTVLVLIIATALPGLGEQKSSDNFFLEVVNVSTDKPVYHSSEVMKVHVFLYSESSLNDVSVSAESVNGRFKEKKLVNASKGLNEVSFTYTLPRCNVCGGIKVGDYEVKGTVEYGNVTVNKSTKINIQQ